jgi:hypothetical protein
MQRFLIFFPSIFGHSLNLKLKKMKDFMSVLLVVCFAILGFNAQANNTFSVVNSLKIATDTTALVEYKGKYNFPNDAPVTEVTIIIEKEALVAKSEQGNFPLKPVENKVDNFTIEEISGEVVFTRDENKKITGMSVKMPDGTLVAKKEVAK